MRRIVLRRAAWVVAAWLIAPAVGWADNPPPADWKPPATNRKAPSRLPPRPAAPEQGGPPVVIPPPSVEDLPPASAEELRPPPPDIDLPPVPPVRPAADRTPALPPASPDRLPDRVAETPDVPPAPVIPETPTAAPAIPEGAATAPCLNPWVDWPPVQVFPRLGLFLVPPTGPGFYSYHEWLHGFCRDKPPAYPYPPFALQPPSGFDADYRYLDKPDNTQLDPFDVVKRVRPTAEMMLTVGGQHSVRYMSEIDSRLTKRDNAYTLYRNRVWADYWYLDQVRVYGEFISALQTGNELPPLPIDENRADILNLFVEVNVADVLGNPVHVRAGRQEVLFGSQRLVTTLDWANTRRTFEGVRAFSRSETLDLDAFWTRPVLVEPGNLDSANDAVQFYGTWVTFRPDKGQFIDLYYVGLTDETPTRDRFRQADRGDLEVHTFGARLAGNEGPLLFDLEGMVQTGTYVRRDHHACAYTTAVGYVVEDHPWRPQAWAAYDYASGTRDPAAGDHQTFNQLFAFGHYYFGYLDLVGRQNIRDLNFQLAAYPENWVTVVVQYHHFRLAQSRDFLYNAAGRPTRRSPTGAAGRDVGQEFDFLANFHLSGHQDVLVGYSRLFAGEFIRRTGPDVSPGLFYLMYNCRW